MELESDKPAPSMKYVPKELTKEVNVTPIHPLKYLAKVGLAVLFWGILLYFLSGAIADQLVKVLPPSLEANIGRSLISPFAVSEFQPDQEQRLQTLLTDLQGFESIRPPTPNIHLIESETINAGVFPGGQMILTSALLDAIESENELAFVLAHELGHHQLRHPSRRLGRSVLWLIVLSFLGMGQQTQTIPHPTGPVTVIDLQFNRTQETQADQFALKLIENKYGHIAHALDFFQRLEDLNRDRNSQYVSIEFLATHPSPRNRISNLRRYAKRQNWKKDGPKTNF